MTKNERNLLLRVADTLKSFNASDWDEIAQLVSAVTAEQCVSDTPKHDHPSAVGGAETPDENSPVPNTVSELEDVIAGLQRVMRVESARAKVADSIQRQRTAKETKSLRHEKDTLAGKLAVERAHHHETQTKLDDCKRLLAEIKTITEKPWL